MQLDLQGWNSTAPIFEKLILEKQPSHIIEVGTWKGASAIHMASIIKKHGIQCKITCVDTWLGALEFYTDPLPSRNLMLVDGYPSVYYQFLYNVRETGNEDIISAFPNTSSIAVRYFRYENIKADLIYIDGSHDYDDVKSDMSNYFGLLNPGGIMFGDDYNSVWPGVLQAYDHFCYEFGVNKEIVDNNYWVART